MIRARPVGVKPGMVRGPRLAAAAGSVSASHAADRADNQIVSLNERTSLDIRANAPASFRAADPLHAAAAEAMLAFARAVKNSQIYPPGSPMSRRGIEAACEMIQAVCAEFGPLRLKVQQARFLIDLVPAYEDPDDVAGLARRFFRDGVREITFLPGIELAEVEAFVAAVVAAGGVSLDADDLVTLLWGSELPHITYEVIDDIEWECADGSVDLDENDSGEAFLDIEIQELLPPEAGRVSAPRALLDRVPTTDPHEALSGRDDASLLVVSPQEEAEIARALAAERHTDLVRDAVWIVREILAGSVEPPEDLIASLVRAARVFLASGNLTGGVQILRCLLEEPEPRPAAVTAAVEKLVAVLGEPECLALLEKALESGELEAHQTVRGLVPVLPAGSLDSLCGMLGRLQSRQARHVLCEALGSRSFEDVPAIARWLSDGRWYLVRNIVGVLQQIGDRRAAPLLRPVLTHSDLRVRRQAFRAFAALGGKEAFAYLARSLDDPDPRARLAAAFALATLGEPGVGPLVAAVRRRDFSRRSSEERRGFFEALGLTGARALVPYLERLLKSRSLFRRTSQEETACHAAAALGRLGGPEARAALETASETGSDAIRRSIRQALDRLRGGGARPWS